MFTGDLQLAAYCRVRCLGIVQCPRLLRSILTSTCLQSNLCGLDAVKMDENVSEGISASFQSCPQSYDLQELLGLESFSPSRSYLNLDFNDLGLTPPPGSQLQQQENGATQAPLSEIPVHDSNQQDENSPPGPLGDVPDAFLLDPLFDSDRAIRELEAALDSQKRTCDDAFPGEVDFRAPPEKRRAIDLVDNNDATPPERTPSLSSPGSSHRNESDQAETSFHTPADRERSQTPDSLFDSTEPPLQEPASSELGASAPKDASINRVVDADTGNQVTAKQRVEITQPYPSASDITKEQFSITPQDTLNNTYREILQRVDQEPQYVSPYPKYGGALGYLPSSPAIHVKYTEVGDTTMNDRIQDLRKRLRRASYERDKYKNSWFKWMRVDSATGKVNDQVRRDEVATLRRINSLREGKMNSLKQETADWKRKYGALGVTYNNLLLDFEKQRKMCLDLQQKLAYMASAPRVSIPGQQAPPQPTAPAPYYISPAQPSQNRPFAATPTYNNNPVPGTPQQALPTSMRRLKPTTIDLTTDEGGPSTVQAQAASSADNAIDLTEDPSNDDLSARLRPGPAASAAPNTTPTPRPTPSGRKAELLLESVRNKSYDWMRRGTGNAQNQEEDQQISTRAVSQTACGRDYFSDRDRQQITTNTNTDTDTGTDTNTSINTNTGHHVPIDGDNNDDDEELIRQMEEELAR